ncbi:MAG: hypothetical protein HY347_01700 [candidate division NC10 bacterium]|nr:hypothetical protein [candidate division NC10 bacterium]
MVGRELLKVSVGVMAISLLAAGCGGMFRPASTGGLPREKTIDGEKYVLVRNQTSRSPYGPGQGGVPEYIYVREDIAQKGPPSLGNLVLGAVGSQVGPAKTEVKVKPEDQGQPQGGVPAAIPANPMIVRSARPSSGPVPQVLSLTQPAAPPPPVVPQPPPAPAVVAAAPTPAPPPPSAPLPKLKRRVAVLGFEVKAAGAWGALEMEVAQLLVSHLKASPALLLVDPILLVETLERHGARPGEVPGEEVLSTVGRELSLQAFLRVSVGGTEIQPPSERQVSSIRIDLAVLDGATGRVLKTATRSLSMGGKDSLGEVIGALTREVVPEIEAIPWSSRIAVVEEEKVYLPVGQRTGVNVTDLFEVYSPGDEIIDPVTQRSLGFTPGVAKGQVQVMTLFGTDAAMAVIREGKGFSTNDLVRPLSP